MAKVIPNRVFILLVLLIILSGLSTTSAFSAPLKKDQIDQFIEQERAKAKVPGLSVAVIHNDETYIQGYGTADINEETLVNKNTLFELGSNSKAFTGLALLRLADENKVQLGYPVSRYLPWFQSQYKGQRVEITLSQLLYHTSGISYKTIAKIPIDRTENALYRTVYDAIPLELQYKPGEKYEYATLNYDIIGLVIQQVSGELYDDYMRDHIFSPLGLKSTMTREQLHSKAISAGHRFGIFGVVPYEAPTYRGNTPAGYIYSNAKDMSRWLQLQLGLIKSGYLDQVIKQAQIPDRTVAPAPDGSSYAGGWHVYQNGLGQMEHDGVNPNFSSYVIIKPDAKIAIAVLGNMNSEGIPAIAKGIFAIMEGQSPLPSQIDPMLKMNQVALALILMCLVFFVIISVALIKFILEAVRNKKKIILSNLNYWKICAISISFSIYIAAIYYLPYLLYEGYPWHFLLVWSPSSLIWAVIALYSCGSLYFIYSILTAIVITGKEISYLKLILVSIASGVGNSLLIFVLNQVMIDTHTFKIELLGYFLLGMLIYIFGQKIVRNRLVKLANELIYKTRMELTEKILNSSYYQVNTIGKDKLFSVLNNDTESISGFIGIAITGATAFITLLCCLMYMAFMSMGAFLLTMLVILLSVTLYYVVGSKANKLWEQTRDSQNGYFKLLNAMFDGFKELSVHSERNADFKTDIHMHSEDYKNKRVEGDLKFANVFIVGELLFTIVIGCIAFIFPNVFHYFGSEQLRSYVFILLFITGPINQLLDSVPQIMQIRICWKRIQDLRDEVYGIHDEVGLPTSSIKKMRVEQLTCEELVYEHQSEDGRIFKVGPLNMDFRAGEVTFITGGNGSGKTTTAHLLTGLYQPLSGNIYVNGNRCSNREIGQYVSAIYSDYYLFEQLYGLQLDEREQEIENYLELLQLKDKVHIAGNKLSTTRLSAGQRRRLALLVAYLEERSVYLFDEWAADQDPEFRDFFYLHLIPKLKEQGKCIIAITHDDRYFNFADQLIKMEFGHIAEIKHLSNIRNESKREVPNEKLEPSKLQFQ